MHLVNEGLVEANQLLDKFQVVVARVHLQVAALAPFLLVNLFQVGDHFLAIPAARPLTRLRLLQL